MGLALIKKNNNMSRVCVYLKFIRRLFNGATRRKLQTQNPKKIIGTPNQPIRTKIFGADGSKQ
jgi:hypothetical protein